MDKSDSLIPTLTCLTLKVKFSDFCIRMASMQIHHTDVVFGVFQSDVWVGAQRWKVEEFMRAAAAD